MGLRKKEIQLKTLIKQNPAKEDIEEDYSNLFSSKFYKNLLMIQKIEDILKIENLDQFIKDYEDYIVQLETMKKVNKN